MDKLKMHTPNKADENFQKLAALFPNAVTETITGYDEEGKPIVERAIDKDVLMQEISTTVVEGKDERYQFTWPDKKKSILLANSPISKTLRPCREESVDFDNTENLYIEGDNLDVLKILQETYLGKIKMIYIDPPYNTGNDFVYNDDFAESTEEYLANSGQFDEEGNRLVQNTESNGRFHTDWLNMIYPRLKLAKDLLSEDGVIFISIDDNEVENLRKSCDEIYGVSNFVAQLSIIVKTEGRQYGYFAKTHEYVLIYAKSINSVTMNEIKVTDGIFKYSDEKGGFNTIGLRNRAVRIFNSTNRPNLRYPFYVDINNKDEYGFSKVSTIPFDGWKEVWASVVDGLESVWRWGKETAEKNKDELVALQGNDGEIRIFKKDRDLTTLPKTVWFEKELNSIVGTREVANIVGKGMFDFPKPLYLLKRIIEIATNENSLVLDFFSGSATTAHAVMQLNVEDGGNRKFIMVQLPEETDEKSEAYKAGYKNICEIGKERIRRASKKIAEENSDAKFDGGFRVLKLDSTNMKDVYYNPSEFIPSLLDNLADNIKEDRTPEDLLFQVMLDLGVLLSSKIEENIINGKKVFNVEGNYLIACFDENVTDETITAIAKQKPYYFVMRDSSMANDSVATNFEQIFATYSPDTVRKVM
ncbi:MAG: site-specific DNA-methyltransferase [Oscillospiraceae bacterium]|nr:site-specific DNA-methyltransferase [Oscillospiraceae bacterium]